MTKDKMEAKMTKGEYDAILKMAKDVSCAVRDRGDLETRHNDEEDFLDQSVWGLKMMLIQAYMMGKEQGRKDKE